MEQSFYRLSCKALIYDDTMSKILLFKESNGRYDFPGWGLDFGEKPQDNIRRELAEEAGLHVDRVADNPSYLVTSLKDNNACRVAYIFFETMIQDTNFTPSDECQALEFFTKEEALKLDLYSTVRMFFEQLP